MTTDELAENTQRIEELLAAPPVARSRRTVWFDRIKHASILIACAALAIALFSYSRGQVSACRESNRVRAQVESLWQYLVDESRKNNTRPTAKQSADTVAFEARIRDTYAPRKC